MPRRRPLPVRIPLPAILACGILWSALPAEAALEITGVDERATAAELAVLSALTALPLVFLAAGLRSGTVPPETVVASTAAAVPALIGWPVFYFESSRARRQKTAAAFSPRP